MKRFSTSLSAVLVLSLVPAFAHAQDAALPLPSYGTMLEAPGAKELPDPKIDYKVYFDLSAAGSDEQIYPMFLVAARYVNTLAKFGVPAEHRHVAMIIHGNATDFALGAEEYGKRHAGKPNLSAPVLDALMKGGVSVRVAGSALMQRMIPVEAVLPGIQVDLWAGHTAVSLDLQGYSRLIGF